MGKCKDDYKPKAYLDYVVLHANASNQNVYASDDDANVAPLAWWIPIDRTIPEQSVSLPKFQILIDFFDWINKSWIIQFFN